MVVQLQIWHLRPIFPPVCRPSVDRTRWHQRVSSQRTSLDNSGCVRWCAVAVRLLVSRCNLHAAQLPDFWMVKGGGGGFGEREGVAKLLTIMWAALAASSSKKPPSLGRGRPAIKWICQTDSQVGTRLFPSNILTGGFLTSAGKVLENVEILMWTGFSQLSYLQKWIHLGNK